MLFICFILIIVILIFIRITLYNETKNINSFDSKILDLDNGDLIFASYNNVLGKIVKVWSGSKWTHIGMIFKNPDNGNLSVLEVAEYNNPNFEKGVIEVPLNAWLKMNKDFEIGYRKMNIKTTSCELYDLFEKYQGNKLYKLSVNPNRIKEFIFPSHRTRDIKDLANLSCVDFTVLMLKDLKLIKRSHVDFTTVSDIIDYLDDIVENEGNMGKSVPVGKLT
jgi:hypothetical protein